MIATIIDVTYNVITLCSDFIFAYSMLIVDVFHCIK